MKNCNLKKTVILFFIFNMNIFMIANSSDVTIEIIHPKNNSEVGHNELVRGKVTQNDINIYVLVHPMLTNLWWVQRPPAGINSDGSWQTIAYFGTENQGIGEYFELSAIATDRNYKEGQTLKEIPANAVRSDIITVKRTH